MGTSKIEGGYGDGAGHTPLAPPEKAHPALEEANSHSGSTATPKHAGAPNGRGERKREGSH